MSFGITKTIPAKEGIQAVEKLYNGSIREFEFHMAGKPSKLNVGDYVYTIFEDKLRGRLKIIRLEVGARTLIYVKCPGEKLKNPINKKGHRGTRYYDGSDWK